MTAGPGEPGSAPRAAGYSGTPLPRKLGIKAGRASGADRRSGRLRFDAGLAAG